MKEKLIKLSEVELAMVHLRAINNPKKLKIINHLSKHGKPMTVAEIEKELKLGLQVTTQNIALLKRSDILISDRSFRSATYTLNHQTIDRLLKGISLLLGK